MPHKTKKLNFNKKPQRQNQKLKKLEAKANKLKSQFLIDRNDVQRLNQHNRIIELIHLLVEVNIKQIVKEVENKTINLLTENSIKNNNLINNKIEEEQNLIILNKIEEENIINKIKNKEEIKEINLKNNNLIIENNICLTKKENFCQNEQASVSVNLSTEFKKNLTTNNNNIINFIWFENNQIIYLNSQFTCVEPLINLKNSKNEENIGGPVNINFRGFFNDFVEIVIIFSISIYNVNIWKRFMELNLIIYKIVFL
ncbi:hypothetical protein Mgra_00008853 [Meloidogyne graminicola]|uniref:Uncharacterized protein n=1 Tax=Meloidogyne graminicola TaxID=189291 RepID=A0A8S9ZEI9_9BILA|nr:hypothetical protein Mgra_00008853 [Meloidogyne graminicola]